MSTTCTPTHRCPECLEGQGVHGAPASTPDQDLPAPLTDDETLDLIYTLAESVGIVVVGRATADIIRLWDDHEGEAPPTPEQIAAVREHEGFRGDHLNDLMLDATYDELVRAIEEVKEQVQA